jgi:hypothetical protein
LNNLLEQFKEDGYFVLKANLDRTAVDEILGAIGEVFDRGLQTAGESGKGLSVDEKYLLLARKSPALKSRCYDLLGRLEVLHRTILSARIMEAGRRIFGTTLLLDGMMVRIGEPSNDRLLPMHQDFGHISKLNLNVWTALTPMSETRGGLRIVPGSHKLGRVPHRYYDSKVGTKDHGIVEEQLNGRSPMVMELDPGDTILFHPYLFHGSAANHVKELRWSAICRLNELREISYLSGPDAPLRWPQHSGELFGDKE